LLRVATLSLPTNLQDQEERIMLRIIGSAILIAAVSSVAMATVGAPEIDPASALSGLTLLAGALAVLRGRRSKN